MSFCLESYFQMPLLTAFNNPQTIFAMPPHLTRPSLFLAILSDDPTVRRLATFTILERTLLIITRGPLEAFVRRPRDQHITISRLTTDIPAIHRRRAPLPCH